MNNSIRISPVSYDGDGRIEGYDIELRMISGQDMITLADIIAKEDANTSNYLYNLCTKIKNTLEEE